MRALLRARPPRAPKPPAQSRGGSFRGTFPTIFILKCFLTALLVRNWPRLMARSAYGKVRTPCQALFIVNGGGRDLTGQVRYLINVVITYPGDGKYVGNVVFNIYMCIYNNLKYYIAYLMLLFRMKRNIVYLNVKIHSKLEIRCYLHI